MSRTVGDKQEGYIQVGKACWVRDPSGLWHFNNQHAASDVHGAAHLAIGQPAPGPSWFWFNDEPVPIYQGDTVESLIARWRHWTAMMQDDDKALHALLRALPREGGRSR